MFWELQYISSSPHMTKQAGGSYNVSGLSRDWICISSTLNLHDSLVWYISLHNGNTTYLISCWERWHTRSCIRCRMTSQLRDGVRWSQNTCIVRMVRLGWDRSDPSSSRPHLHCYSKRNLENFTQMNKMSWWMVIKKYTHNYANCSSFTQIYIRCYWLSNGMLSLKQRILSDYFI